MGPRVVPPPPKAKPKPKFIPPRSFTKAVALPPGRVPPSLRQFSTPVPLPPGRVDPLVYEEYEKMEVGRVEVEKEVGGGRQLSQQQTDEPKMMEVEKTEVEKMEVEKMEVENVEVEPVVDPVHVDVMDEVETVTAAERSLQAKSACRPVHMSLRRYQQGIFDPSVSSSSEESVPRWRYPSFRQFLREPVESDRVLSILTTNHDTQTLLASTGWRPSGYQPTRAPLSDTSPADS